MPFYGDDIQWRHQNFFVGGIEGAKCDSEGANIQKFAKNSLFWPFFLLTGGQVGGSRASDCGGNVRMPPRMPPLMISSPPESKLIYEYKENTWKIVQGLLQNFQLVYFPPLIAGFEFQGPVIQRGILKIFNPCVRGGLTKITTNLLVKIEFTCFSMGLIRNFHGKIGPYFFFF